MGNSQSENSHHRQQQDLRERRSSIFSQLDSLNQTKTDEQNNQQFCNYDNSKDPEHIFGKLKNQYLNTDRYIVKRYVKLHDDYQVLEVEKSSQRFSLFYKQISDQHENELKYLNKLNKIENKRHILDLVDIKQYSSMVCYICESYYCDLEYIQQVLKDKNEKLSYLSIISFAQQMVNCLRILEKNEIAHSYLSPNKIFYDKQTKTFKVGNFGKIFQVQQQPNILLDQLQDSLKKERSYIYTSPEINVNQEYRIKQDIYSLGIIILELTFNYPLSMYNRTQLEKEEEIEKQLNDDETYCDLNKVIKQMLRINPNNRINLETLKVELDQLLQNETVNLLNLISKKYSKQQQTIVASLLIEPFQQFDDDDIYKQQLTQKDNGNNLSNHDSQIKNNLNITILKNEIYP